MTSRIATLRGSRTSALVLAATAAGLALALRVLAAPVLGDRVLFIFLFPAVLASAWYGSRLAGMVTLVLGALGTLLLFPVVTSGPSDPVLAYVVSLVLYVTVSITMIELVMAMRRAEARAVRTQIRLDTMLDHAPLMVFAKDRAGRYMLVNAVFAKLAGKRIDQIVGATDVELFGPELAAEFAAEDRLVFSHGEPRQFEETFELEGRHMTFLTSKFLLRDVDGSPMAVCGIANEISDRKRVEAELKDADRRKDEFLAVLAHELRNPLAPIRLGLEMLRDKADHVSATRAMDIMNRQLAHLVRLIDDLLDVSRITRGRLELRREPVLLAEVVRAGLETAKPLVDAAGHQLHVSVPDEPLRVDADVTRLAQVIANLVANAAKYTPGGGRIDVRAERRGDEVAIAVEDTGVGLAPEHLHQVFEMFTQVGPSRRTESGLGIGLALARALVELHGGRIEASSAGVGRGSTFVVHLPIAQAEPARDVAASARPPTCEPGLRVLVADDNLDARDTLAMYLEGLGHDVHTACDGAEAIRVASEHPPQVAILDIGMPELDGYEVARQLRASGSSATLIALTGWGQTEDRRRSREAGFDHHLVKPVQPAILVQLLDGVDRAA